MQSLKFKMIEAMRSESVQSKRQVKINFQKVPHELHSFAKTLNCMPKRVTFTVHKLYLNRK